MAFPRQSLHAPIAALALFIALPAVGGQTPVPSPAPSQTPAPPFSKTVTVNGSQGPWFYDKGGGGTNSIFQYGVDDQDMPAVVSSASGFSFKPGATLTVKYLSGSVKLSPDGRYFAPTASGCRGTPVNDGTGNSGTKFPSAFFDHPDYPAALGVLTGVFANGLGVIVGKPFPIRNSRSFPVPAGATQLQLGINDDIYGDNSGSFTVTISQDSSEAAHPAAQPILASSVQWQGGAFGALFSAPETIFFLMATGFFQSTTSPDMPGIVAQWLRDHPKALLVNVASLGQLTDKDPNSRGIYVWVVDGAQNLNLDLVRQGCVYPETQAIGNGEELLAPQPEYDAFVKEATAAGKDAKEKKLGIWKTDPGKE